MKGCQDEIVFQTDFVLELAKDCNYMNGVDIDVTQIFFDWEHDKGSSHSSPEKTKNLNFKTNTGASQLL